ncbi:hypothetical protein B5S31_g5194 [[Candida] boidinii]|uniref:Unnamed protein product n=1 Tax=Candida boidinii TaxID=5477 RepID=A0ACB5TKT8_CANBO|nr:hypothetical protein B5S29_g5273 [[Candida] boidinii]OWB75311.1 hypothetical protein B5S31_g5194 [[Candida] boidinii]GME90208.1 unnamed protein product [[Candida] boidinii]GMF16316.1 unnamed protein product [[Candida] boidinii]
MSGARSILSLNLAAKCFVKIPQTTTTTTTVIKSNTVKHFTSYSRPALSYFDMYNDTESHPLDKLYNEQNNDSKIYSSNIHNSAGDAHVEHSTMTHIDNTLGGVTHEADAAHDSFQPVVSGQNISTTGFHSKI